MNLPTIQFRDLLYGMIELPRWIAPFLRIPEFARLRHVRLSNVDSLDFKDFGSITRWEHGIAVAYLAWLCGGERGLPLQKRAELTLAGLLHDIATPPFAHTAESVIESFDHELETERILSAIESDNSTPHMPVFGSSLPQFCHAVHLLGRKEKIKVDPDEVARMVIGESDLGFLISGTVDLDNADNVIRGCAHMGMNVEKDIPLRLARWLAKQDCAPTDLDNEIEPAVRAWLRYRSKYYAAFFQASDQEIGRQAFLQHLMRRALRAGLPPRALVWNTDDALLNTIGGLQEPNLRKGDATLADLVERYHLMEQTYRWFELEVDDQETWRVLRGPSVISWLEDRVSGPHLEPFVLLLMRRYQQQDGQSMLFSQGIGQVVAFKLGGEIQHWHLPDWLRALTSKDFHGARLQKAIGRVMRIEIQRWVKDRPWFSMTPQRRESVVENLKSAGDWSFRLTRNENLHAYPSTFVHAIPASLINSLGLRGEVIMDPFGGTGQTAVEGIKYECDVISVDSNTIATLIAQVRLTHLNAEQRSFMRTITVDQLKASEPCEPPEFELRGKWHHPKTLEELCKIWAFVHSIRDQAVRQFLVVCFSAILPASTARRGKEHGFFADNTPLPSDLGKPPYCKAADLFLARVRRNVEILARFYSFLERRGRDPEKELRKARVLQLDSSNASASDYEIGSRSVGAIITSPPYLCMADYTLGQRLSYYWIAPAAFKLDFENEIGARRSRFNPKVAVPNYFDSIRRFARVAGELVRSGGFFATVLGTPVAERFKDIDILKQMDEILEDNGFELIWDKRRPIHWHRNQGYQRVRSERVSVHVRR